MDNNNQDPNNPAPSNDPQPSSFNLDPNTNSSPSTAGSPFDQTNQTPPPAFQPDQSTNLGALPGSTFPTSTPTNPNQWNISANPNDLNFVSPVQTSQNPDSTPVPTFPLPDTPQPGEPSNFNSQPPANLAPTDINAALNLPVGQINTSDVSSNPSNPPSISAEPAPTDLSQLTGSGEQPPPDVYVPPVSSPENLVVPAPSSHPESINVAHNSPKKSLLLIIGGGIIVLIVSAASAYFILGIGKPATPAPQTSLPAQQALTNPPKQIAATPQPTAIETSNPDATASGNTTLGSLTSDSSSPSAKPASALDRLRQRQTPQ